MCFSATASFITAGITGTIGILTLRRARGLNNLPLAATPVLFALQQGVEGLLWLNLPRSPEGPISTGLTYLFLFFAQVFWPVYVPITAALIEPNERRRKLIFVCVALGLGVGAFFLWPLVTQHHSALIMHDHIVYVTEYRYSDAVALTYLAAASLPLLVSSQRTVFALGAVILAGSVVAYVFYWEAFVSVWCFFAAGASVVLLWHFEWSRKKNLRTARA